MVKILLLTSKVTFVPNNYDDLIIGLAKNPAIGGLLMVDNSNFYITKTSLGLMALGAPRVGSQLLQNQLGGSTRRRLQAYRKADKPVWILPKVNTQEVLDIVKNEGFDLILNARTRSIFKKPLLNAPPLGCLNVHHGILPENRGTMCDLWALAEGGQPGFSIHVMNEKIDDGALVKAVPFKPKNKRDYRKYLKESTLVELETIEELIAKINDARAIPTAKPVGIGTIAYRRNPDRNAIREMIKGGMKL